MSHCITHKTLCHTVSHTMDIVTPYHTHCTMSHCITHKALCHTVSHTKHYVTLYHLQSSHIENVKKERKKERKKDKKNTLLKQPHDSCCQWRDRTYRDRKSRKFLSQNNNILTGIRTRISRIEFRSMCMCVFVFVFECVWCVFVSLICFFFVFVCVCACWVCVVLCFHVCTRMYVCVCLCVFTPKT